MEIEQIKFSIPYNGSIPFLFLNEVLKRALYIDHIYCEFPLDRAISHFKQFINHPIDMEIQKIYMDRCKEFLKISYGKVKRICTINAGFYSFNETKSFYDFCNNVVQITDEYKIDGLILTDYNMGQIIHQLRPELDLQTSCNCFIWSIKTMQMWQDNVGVTIFNPPREILRAHTKLKEMADAGFRLKCLIDASCLYGCPNTINHAICISTDSRFNGYCYQNGIGDIFRCNYVIPRWLDSLKQYVSVFKISGRNSTQEAMDGINMRPFILLDAFVSRENKASIFDFFGDGPLQYFRNSVPKEVLDKITLDKVPDKVLTCECKDCKNCGLCDTIAKKLIPSEYHHILDKPQIITVSD